MNNPYTQQYSEGDRGGRWGSDEQSGTQNWRGDPNREQGRFGQQGSYGQQGRYAQQQASYGQQGYGQQGSYGQYRNSPNFSGQQGGEYGQEWQRGDYDDYGYESNQQRRQWGQEYSPYSGQGEPEYNPNIVPRHQQPIRAENQRWGGQQSRDSQQPWQGQGRTQNYGNQFGRQDPWPRGGQSTFGDQFRGGQSAGLDSQTYGGQHYGTQYGNDQAYRRASLQSSGSETGAHGQTGAYGLQQAHRGKGPKGYTRTDERIREEICELLSDDFSIDASEISVQVKDGVVTLEGTVQDRTQKHRAEDLADNCSGVKDVHNGLRVTRQASQQQTGDKPQEKTGSKSH